MTRTGRRWVLAGLAGLFAAWMAAPAAVPIYDGLANPDEPYRYVNPPPTAKTTKAPTAAQGILNVKDGHSSPQFVNTREQGPQLSLYVPSGALQVPAGATSITVTATPLAPSAPLPDDGTIVTNVYRITATANGQDLSVIGTGKFAPSLQMRAPDGRQPGPVFEHRTANGWERVGTARYGVDIYGAAIPSLGDWALVKLTHPPSSGSGGGVNIALLAGGIGILVVSVAVFAIRLRRTGAVPT